MIIGSQRKTRANSLGPPVARRHRKLAGLRDRAGRCCCSGRKACSAIVIIERHDLIFYPRGGQYKKQLRRRHGSVSRCARTGLVSASSWPSPFSGFPLLGNAVFPRCGDDPACWFRACRDPPGLNLLVGTPGLLVAGTGGVHGVGAFACYKLTTWFPRPSACDLAAAVRACRRPALAPCSACRRCASRVSTWWWRPLRRSSFCSGAFFPRAWL